MVQFLTGRKILIQDLPLFLSQHLPQRQKGRLCLFHRFQLFLILRVLLHKFQQFFRPLHNNHNRPFL